LNQAPATFAYLALLSWLPISLIAFVVMRPLKATLFTILGAMLFLPEGVSFKYPYLPYLDKHNIPYLCVLAGALLRCPKRAFKLPTERWFSFLAIVLLAGALATALTNQDTLRYGRFVVTVLPGLTLKDGFFTGITQSLQHALPFFLGLALVRTAKDLRDVLASFVAAALLYVPFALIEIRLSPQFHQWVYGYHQHSFLQTLRWGGYRPMVFMAHGLALARFFVVATLAALLVAPKRATILGLPSRIAATVLFITLVLCKSTGAVIYGLVALAVVALGKVRIRHAVAVVLASVVLIYPALRAADAIPLDRVLNVAGGVGSDREQSLLFRFHNEDELLVKARQRMVFGWGEYNRSFIFDERGRPNTITDGHWIVIVGVLGMVGFVATFGMLLFPIFVARARVRKIADRSDRMLVSGVAVIIGTIAVDLIPNGLWDGYPYFFAGALMGVTRGLVAAAGQRERREELVRAGEG
jgi:hypothetical protein